MDEDKKTHQVTHSGAVIIETEQATMPDFVTLLFHPLSKIEHLVVSDFEKMMASCEVFKLGVRRAIAPPSTTNGSWDHDKILEVPCLHCWTHPAEGPWLTVSAEWMHAKPAKTTSNPFLFFTELSERTGLP